MIEVLLWVVVLCIVFGLLYYVVTLLPIPEPFKRVAMIVLLLILVIVLLYAFLGAVPFPRALR